jgi:hypothetical protein
MRPKKIFVCKDHDSRFHWCASIVLADDEQDAMDLLDVELINKGLKPYARHRYTFTQIDPKQYSAYILCNGDY